MQRQLLECLNEATAAEFALFNSYGETEATLREFELLQNAKQRIDAYYSRFYVTLRRIYESQPITSRSTLELLARYIDEAEATVDAIRATIQEIRRDFNLP